MDAPLHGPFLGGTCQRSLAPRRVWASWPSWPVGESRPIRGLVRRNVASNRLIRLHSWPCAEERESGELARDRKDDLADVVARLEVSVSCGGLGQGEHSQRWLLDGVVGDQRPDVLDETAADRCLLLDWPGAQ